MPPDRPSRGLQTRSRTETDRVLEQLGGGGLDDDVTQARELSRDARRKRRPLLPLEAEKRRLESMLKVRARYGEKSHISLAEVAEVEQRVVAMEARQERIATPGKAAGRTTWLHEPVPILAGSCVRVVGYVDQPPAWLAAALASDGAS